MQEITKTAPAFQFYASDTMADKRYRSMSLEERGLFISILCECWVNRSIPADPLSIGKWLGFSKEVIEAALTRNVLSFFVKDGDELKSTELERYRTKLEEGREKMSKGGKKGAKKRWNNASPRDSYPINPPNGVSMGPRVERSRNEKNRREEKDQYSKDKEDVSNDDNEEWLAEYHACDSSLDKTIPF